MLSLKNGASDKEGQDTQTIAWLSQMIHYRGWVLPPLQVRGWVYN